MVIDLHRSKSLLQQVSISGIDIQVVQSYAYLGVHLDCKLNQSANTQAVYEKGQSRFYLRKLRSLDECGEMLHMCHQSVVAGTFLLLFAGEAVWQKGTPGSWTS